jgi:hypothetical protein
VSWRHNDLKVGTGQNANYLLPVQQQSARMAILHTGIAGCIEMDRSEKKTLPGTIDLFLVMPAPNSHCIESDFYWQGAKARVGIQHS